jgi:hypothetical protein
METITSNTHLALTETASFDTLNVALGDIMALIGITHVVHQVEVFCD